MNSSLPISSVAILLCTYNGAEYLSEQLDSLEKQTHKNWRVIVSDDGSTDKTIDILHAYKAKWPNGKLDIRNGPKKGFCQNFLSLACDTNIKADYYAFCDQDDVWMADKLQVGLECILRHRSDYVDNSALYCGRTTYVDESLKVLGSSPLFVFPCTFRNALVQSIAGGNTMVFNHQLKVVLEKAGRVDVPSHDWWTYLIATAHGGEVHYDRVSYILYRQHKDSLVGENSSFMARMARFKYLMGGRFKNWNSLHVAALKQNKSLLTFESRKLVDYFETLRHARLIDRMRLMEVCGLYRQNWRGTISLMIANFLNKI